MNCFHQEMDLLLDKECLTESGTSEPLGFSGER